jgi:hypothetical protein
MREDHHPGLELQSETQITLALKTQRPGSRAAGSEARSEVIRGPPPHGINDG